MRLFFCLLLVILSSSPTFGQVEVQNIKTNSVFGYCSDRVDYHEPEMEVGYSDSDFGSTLKRCFAVFPANAVPETYTYCKLQIHVVHAGASVDLSVEGSPGETIPFDFDFTNTVNYCGRTEIFASDETIQIDVTDCIADLLTGEYENLVFRFSMRFLGPTGEVTFASAVHPGLDQPTLVFLDAVPVQGESMGDVKSMFR